MPKFRSTERTTVYDGSRGLRVDLGRDETVDLTGEEAKMVAGVDGVSKVTPAKKKDD